MPVLSDAELRIVAEVVTELAKYRGTGFDKTSKGTAFARAALIDPAFKARLAETHRRLEARRKTDITAQDAGAARAGDPRSRARRRGGAEWMEAVVSLPRPRAG